MHPSSPRPGRPSPRPACRIGSPRSEGDMRQLDFEPASFDLIWCEGAAYIMGVEAALRAWRPLLKPGGRLALSEAAWLRPEPARGGPALLGGVSGDDRRCRMPRAGSARRLRPLGRFPAARRGLVGLLPPAAGQARPDGRDAMPATAKPRPCWPTFQGEIDAYREFGDDFGYLFLVAALPTDIHRNAD